MEASCQPTNGVSRIIYNRDDFVGLYINCLGTWRGLAAQMELQDASKTEAAYQLLRREILTTRLMPGSPLNLSQLSKIYGIGWTPLREALSRLEAERLVTSISNRGFAVALVSRAELEDLARARKIVELPLLAESIERGSEAWEEAVVVAHHRLSRCPNALQDPSNASVDEWIAKHNAFHTALLSAARSNWLLRFQSAIFDQLQRHHRVLGVTPTLDAVAGGLDGHEEALAALARAQSIESHTALMDAALARDTDKAITLMTEHISFTLDVFVSSEKADAIGRPKKSQSRGRTSG